MPFAAKGLKTLITRVIEGTLGSNAQKETILIS